MDVTTFNFAAEVKLPKIEYSQNQMKFTVLRNTIGHDLRESS